MKVFVCVYMYTDIPVLKQLFQRLRESAYGLCKYLQVLYSNCGYSHNQ